MKLSPLEWSEGDRLGHCEISAILTLTFLTEKTATPSTELNLQFSLISLAFTIT
jgi:hypothetical protein